MSRDVEGLPLDHLDILDLLDDLASPYLGSEAATGPIAASRIAPSSVATSLRDLTM